MHLLDFPDEILRCIALHLDIDSFIAFESVNLRLREALRYSRKSLQIRHVSSSLMKWIRRNGSSIRELDVSDSEARQGIIDEIILRCPEITALSADDASILDTRRNLHVPRLRKLNLTVCHRYFDGFNPAFASIRELHIEVLCGVERLRFVMVLLNFCECLEVLCLHMMRGTHSHRFEDFSLPCLVAERWATLRTVVCCSTLMDGFRLWVQALLRAIFANHRSYRIRENIELRTHELFIYEYGQCNLNNTDEIVLSDKLKLLKRLRYIDLTLGEGSVDFFKSSLSSHRSVRLVGSPYRLLSELDIPLSTTVSELDMTECHGNYKASDRLSLIASLPRLQVLAYPICLFVPTEAKGHAEGNVAHLQKKLFADALGKLRLRKLFVKGVWHEGSCVFNCSCDRWNCKRCLQHFTGANLVDLNGLADLEEMSFIGVNVDDSAYQKMANSRVRTIRLCLGEDSNNSGIGGFIQRCSSLKYLKIECFHLDVASAHLWKMLERGLNLKQLCVTTGPASRIDGPSTLSSDFVEVFKQVIQRVDLMHIHSRTFNFARVADCIARVLPKEQRIKIWFTPNPRSQLRLISAGRSLCIPESFVGVVRPIRWDSYHVKLLEEPRSLRR